VFDNVRSAVTARRRLNWSFWKRLDRMEEVTLEADEILERVGLVARRNVRANSLPYGEQRRLEIGLTIGLRPDLVLLDEPCSGLNAEDTERAIALVRRLTEGKTLMMVEHDMNVVFGLADRISVMYYGKVLATGSAEEIRGNPEVQRSYLARRASAARA
jgi:branched-chain amino acid transport system ATP-binding protein